MCPCCAPISHEYMRQTEYMLLWLITLMANFFYYCERRHCYWWMWLIFCQWSLFNRIHDRPREYVLYISFLSFMRLHVEVVSNLNGFNSIQKWIKCGRKGEKPVMWEALLNSVMRLVFACRGSCCMKNKFEVWIRLT